MPDPDPDERQPTAATVAQSLAAGLEERGCDYALGGAIALGYWGEPRGTVDVDITIFLAPDAPDAVLELLDELGCELDPVAARASLVEHGFCRIKYAGVRVDVFLPTIEFYHEARARRRRVALGEHSIMIWDADTLAVFKMMFFRRRDIADVEQMLRIQGDRLDRHWVERQLQTMYGQRDPRLSQWRELAEEAGN